MNYVERFSSAVTSFDNLIVKAGDLVGLKITDEGKTEKEASALRIVRRYTTLSFFGGLIPIPLADLAAVSSAQLAMLAEIAHVYGVPFSKERTKMIVVSLLGSVVPEGLAGGVAGSAVKSVPVVGTVAGMVLMPTLASGVAYALGKAFIQHFESGGTLLDLNPAQMKAYFSQHLDPQAIGAAATAGHEAPRAAADPAATPAAD